MIKVRTVCLTEIATAFFGRAQIESKYKTLQRFFRFFEIDFDAFAKFLGNLVPIPTEQPWLLTIARTNRKFGKTDINIFVLGLAYQGIAFPLLWVTLTKRGNSNTEKRIKLMEKFIKLFGVDRIQTLTADREFVGFKWSNWLIMNKIPFSIRIRNNFKTTSSKRHNISISVLFKNLRRGETRILRGRRKICGVWLHIIGTKLHDGSFLIVVTNHTHEEALSDFKKTMGNRDFVRMFQITWFRFRSNSHNSAGKDKKDGCPTIGGLLLVPSYRRMEEQKKTYCREDAWSQGYEPVSIRLGHFERLSSARGLIPMNSKICAY